MRAMVLEKKGGPLVMREVPVPEPGPGQVRVKVSACGVCRTDLHVLDGELTEPKLPLIMGHQIVGRVEKISAGAMGFRLGERVGVPWLGGACGHCGYCATGRENLCDAPQFTGYQIDGGFTEFCIANAAFCFRIPEGFPDAQAAPLLCAGLIGYRAYRMAGEGRRLGLYGFGAAAHILCQVARHEGREI